MASSTALFLDGPLQGVVREFDRSEPPPKIYHTVSVCDPTASLDPPRSYRAVDYVRDLNPFDENPRWVYMQEIPVAQSEKTTAAEA